MSKITMELTPIVKAELDLRHERGADSFASLQPGDRLSGRVLRLEADGRALVELGGFRALADIAVVVQPGQILHLKVVTSGTPLILQLVPTQAAAAQPPPQIDLVGLLQPADWQRVDSIMERLLSRIESDLPSQSTAAISRPLESGQSAALSNANPPPTGPVLIDQVRQALAQLRAAVDPAPAPIPEVVPQLAQWVRTALEDCGIFFEKKLAEIVTQSVLPLAGDPKEIDPDPEPLATGVVASPPDGRNSRLAEPYDHQLAVQRVVTQDLKAHLLVLRSFLESSAALGPDAPELTPKEASFLREVVSQMVQHVEQQLERFIQRGAEPESMQVITHLLPMEDPNRPLKLKVYYPKKGGIADQEVHHRVALLLDMDTLGPVRTDLSMIGQHLQITFYVRDATVRSAFETQLPTITDILKKSFDSLQMAVYVSEKKIAQFDSEDLTETAAGRVNVHA